MVFTYNFFITKLRDVQNLQLKIMAPISYVGGGGGGGGGGGRGGGSFALQSGVLIELIRLLGDWKSNAVFLYLTVPLNLQLSYSNQT